MDQFQYEILPDGVLVRMNSPLQAQLDILRGAFPNGKLYRPKDGTGNINTRIFAIMTQTVGKSLYEISVVFRFAGAHNTRDQRVPDGQKLSDKLALMAPHWTVVS